MFFRYLAPILCQQLRSSMRLIAQVFFQMWLLRPRYRLAKLKLENAGFKAKEWIAETWLLPYAGNHDYFHQRFCFYRLPELWGYSVRHFQESGGMELHPRLHCQHLDLPLSQIPTKISHPITVDLSPAGKIMPLLCLSSELFLLCLARQVLLTHTERAHIQSNMGDLRLHHPSAQATEHCFKSVGPKSFVVKHWSSIHCLVCCRLLATF